MKEIDLLKTVVKAADDKKANDLMILNMQGLSPVADYFVIGHGNSDRQVQAIVKEIKDQVYENGLSIKRLEGYDEAKWILIDLGEIVVHIFQKDERSYYNLERLWGDAPTISVESVLSS
ncbi:ribosome-associated protein [Bacillus oleivorans]|uniref:Ribosomal silencing factor RsfS n=1 Tax=Bacillus oleivorans TaxID=1448271 RepID=A0A285CLF5_9BACI|nr:ribosome silencing factor [Bacillus oleivorans]SNX67843.1 ribosome-associated protein [Bacillus oleivorans]